MSLHSLSTRINYLGGNANDRIKKQKYRSFKASLLNDYNSRQIELKDNSVWQALVNLNNLKSDYDKKYVSVECESMLESGDTFMILDNKTHWMLYLQDLAETAYIRSEIIRCRYTLDVDGEKYWVYFQGPTETSIRWALNHGVTYNELNYSGTIYIKNDAKTKDYFSRFKKIKIAGHTWMVKVVDYISVPGIIELEVQEYFDNVAEDLPEIKKEQPLPIDDEIIFNETIIGQDLAQRGSTVGYTIVEEAYDPSIIWKVIGNDNVKVKGFHLDNRICEVEIAECAVGMFTLVYGNHTKEIHIQSFRPEIIGPTEVYPYEVYEYTIQGVDGQFTLETRLARIVDQESENKCKIEITSGRKGCFDVIFDEYITGQRYKLPVKIKSF